MIYLCVILTQRQIIGMKKIFFFAGFIILALPLTAQVKKATAKKLVMQMSTEEKINLVIGMGMNLPGLNAGPTVGEIKDKLPGAAGSTFPIKRLGIPSIILADGPAGLRIQPTRESEKNSTFYCTAFPVGTLLASTWDVDLVYKVGKAMGSEVKAYGADILLAPALNIHRNSLGGRNFEYYSEDPVVSGNMSAAMVNGIESNGVGTSVKHYAANNQETNRNYVNSIVSERALREIYLRGFEIAVKKSQPWTVMSSYNKINGTYTSEDYNLLTTILRNEWGFKGFVMTDWFGGKDAVAQMKAGNDLLMPGTNELNTLLKTALKNGLLDIKTLDENCERILNIVLETPAYKQYKYNNKPDLKANAVIARAAATEGMILLKNENHSLPLDQKIKKIAAFGNTSYNFISGGTGSGDVNEAYTVSLVDGLKNAGFEMNADLKNRYEKFIASEKEKAPKKKYFFELPAPLPEMEITKDILANKVDETDIAIITIGRNAGEFQDRKTENDYYLSETEKQLIKNVSATYHARNKKVILILNTGGVVDVSLWRNDVDAILLAWQGGQEAGNAVTDILSGKVNPSGKLATTFPMSFNDEPSAQTFPGKNLSDKPNIGMGGLVMGFDSESVYTEGIFVGYRYFNTFKIKPAYDFGFGLSYTTFEYSNLKLSASTFRGKINVSVVVKNTGKVAGKEVVQLYITAPSKKLQKPTVELKSFAKTALLQPGFSQTLTFEINPKDLASFDSKSSSWIAEAGKYIVKLGTSSDKILQTSTFSVAKEILVEKCHKVLSPQIEMEELTK